MQFVLVIYSWFELVDKTGKQDKPRGEVLLDIQFMKNNMSASMLDLSMQQVKPGFHISKLKEKVRRRKKNGFSDSASAIVSSSSHISTDSEGEVDTQSLSQSSGGKKKSKLKTFFAPKSNLQRNISQSLSTIKTFPDKNLSPSGSCSSGLNGDPLEGNIFALSHCAHCWLLSFLCCVVQSKYIWMWIVTLFLAVFSHR